MSLGGPPFGSCCEAGMELIGAEHRGAREVSSNVCGVGLVCLLWIGVVGGVGR